ncbi:hypothetical protein GW17_00002933 [Ensete ventricosum]|nr:hypothetical protein GW17_00002933 [Ensete ventricosum]
MSGTYRSDRGPVQVGHTGKLVWAHRTMYHKHVGFNAISITFAPNAEPGDFLYDPSPAGDFFSPRGEKERGDFGLTGGHPQRNHPSQILNDQSTY